MHTGRFGDQSVHFIIQIFWWINQISGIISQISVKIPSSNLSSGKISQISVKIRQISGVKLVVKWKVKWVNNQAKRAIF